MRGVDVGYSDFATSGVDDSHYHVRPGHDFTPLVPENINASFADPSCELGIANITFFQPIIESHDYLIADCYIYCNPPLDIYTILELHCL